MWGGGRAHVTRRVKAAVNLETGDMVAVKILDKSRIQRENLGAQIKKVCGWTGLRENTQKEIGDFHHEKNKSPTSGWAERGVGQQDQNIHRSRDGDRRRAL